ncbi:hypothetical protein RDWZM_002373 [Blomia tropicalis]|uniref:Fasciclin-2-like n=1 Tax=Blomia tropicalis TaxID=40697 RepID=A0A9Q0MF10_BLOTA|nr:hypothetical protein RDWZM_002373 [Blomia tropicalis]
MDTLNIFKQKTSKWTILIIILYVIHCSSQQSSQGQHTLQIQPSGKVLSIPSNDKFVLTCRGQGGDISLFSNLRWYNPNNEDIINESLNPEITRNFKVFESNGNLYLKFLNPKPELNGIYQCKGLLQNSETLSSQIDIKIYEDIKLEQCPQMQYLIKGNVGERINCKASANPKPKIIWTKGSEQLDRNPRYQVNSSGIIIKEPITDNDGGVFQISALVTETGKTYEERITVQIISRPQITVLADTAYGIEDDPIWFDNTRRNLSSVSGYSVDRNSGTLIISRLKKHVDQGNFTCVAENSAGKNERNLQLLVSIRPMIRSFTNGSYEQHKESIIQCRATGDPLPKLSIRMNGMSRPFIQGDPRIRLVENVEEHESVLTLTYMKTTRKDDGLYYCRAENSGGFSEQTGHLQVQFSPDLSLTPLRKVKTWDNRPVNISCIADAIPNATIKWYKHGMEIIRNDIYRIENTGTGKSMLFITPTKLSYENLVFGTYRCEGQNSLGKSWIDIDLERATVPGHVSQVTAVEVTPTQVRFKINNDLYDGGMPIKKLLVDYYNLYNPSDRQKKEIPYSNSETIYIFDKLIPSTMYGFQFQAENEVGKGEVGQEIRIKTKVESRPNKPEFHNLPYDSIEKGEIVSPYPHKFTVMWNLPADNGRRIQYFELKYYPIKKTEFSYTALSPPIIERISLKHDEMTTRTLQKLKANTYYRLELVAFNELGGSDEAFIVFRTPQSTGLNDDEIDELDELNTSSIPIGLISGVTIILIILILLFMDLFFYIQYKVGAIYFLRTHCCAIGNEDESKLNNFGSSISHAEISERERFGNYRTPLEHGDSAV